MDETTRTIRIVIDASKAVEGGREAQRALEAIEKQTAQTAASVVRMESGMDVAALVAKLTAGAYVVKEFVDRITGVFKAARDAAAGIQDFSEQLGVSTDFIQGSMYAAAQNTVSVEKMGQAYTKASQIIGQAAQGQKEAVGFFNDAGVKILDSAGKLRSTERILQDSAIALLRVEDPAKRVAMAVDLFGKSGAQLIPMLGAIATGSEAMAVKASAAGALIEGDTIVALAKLKAHSEETAQKWNALVATLGAPIATAALENFNTFLGDFLDKVTRAQGAWSFLKLSLESSRKEGRIGSGPGALRLATPEEAAEYARDQLAAELEANKNNPAYAGRGGLIAEQQAAVDAAERARLLDRQAGFADDEGRARRFALPASTGAPGASNPGVKGSGQDVAERIRKLKDELGAAAVAQDTMTAAARRGDVAFIEQQASAEATAKAIEAFGGKVSAADPKVRALADTLQKPIFEKMQGAAAQAFVVATTELDKQNVLLEAQNRLMNEAPEIQARELALIKAKQEAEKAGNAITAQDVENRRAAIETNEKLKIQAEQLKQANELWLEPLKQGFRNIQTAGADAWENILRTGEFTFKSLGEVFTNTLRRMAAEFLALATIRPVMSVLVDAIGPGGLGLIGGQSAAQLGFPSGGSGGGILGGFNVGGGSASGGGGGVGLPSFGGGNLGGLFSPGFMQKPIFGGIDSEISNWSSYGSAAGGQAGLFSGAATYGQALGGLASVAGIGMGAYQLANARGPGGIVSGASGIIGGGLGLAALAFPALAGTLGPIGIGIGLAGMLGGSLLSNGGKEIPAAPPFAGGMGNFYDSGAGSYAFGGGSQGPGGSYQSQTNAIGTNLGALYKQAGLTPVAGRLIGGELSSWQDHYWNGDSWVQNPMRTQTRLVNPYYGSVEDLHNNSNYSVEQASEFLLAATFRANINRGGVSGVSPALRTAVNAPGLYTETQAGIQNIVAMSAAYDKLGKSTISAKDAVEKINASFDQLKDFAVRAGLALEPINAEIEKQTKRAAQDFIDQFVDPLQMQLRALQDQKDQALSSAQYIKDNIGGVFVDMTKISDYFVNQEKALRDQFDLTGQAAKAAAQNLQPLIDRLTYGDLANASPDTSLAGTKATYSATLAQARSGNVTAIGNLAGVAEAYTSTARNYFASSPEYAALIDQIRRDLSEALAVATGGTTTATGGAANLNQQSAELVALVSNLAATVQVQSDENAKLRNDVSTLVAQMRSLATNRM